MELVYLWVDDYKNIHHQGFNFSPRFHCEYDEKENKLTINENDDYIPDFFGENINITAIVGKNGSGKSSVLEYLSDSPKFVVTFENNELYVNKDIHINNKTKYVLNLKQDSFTILDLCKIEIFNFIGLENDFLKKQTSMFFHSQQILHKMIFPKKLFYVIDHNECIFSDYNHDKYSRKELLSNFKEMNLSDVIYIFMISEFFFQSYDDINIAIKELEIFFYKNQKILIGKKIFFNLKNELHTIQDIQLYKELEEYATLFDDYQNIYKANNFIEVIKENDGNAGEFIYYIPLLKNENFEKILDKIDNYSNHFFRWDIKLSAGEISFINILSEIFDSLKYSENVKYLYFDECETFLHPNWQKKYISYIVQFIKDNFPNRKIHIILTSHSPFLLSDIPKQNIIFLDKDEKGNCKVVNGLKEKKQTFGANIHTLLSDSFFMEDGLMGEFAKSKIDDVINYLHDRESKIKSDDEAQKLIHIIGEPIVKNQLQRMLDSRRLKKVDEIEAIKKSMEAMQKRLDELEYKTPKKGDKKS